MKFKVGDRIKAESSDKVGYNFAVIKQIIEDIDPYTGIKSYFYSIVWEGFSHNEHMYSESEIDGIWELANPLPQGQCPVINAMDYYKYKVEWIPTETKCDHELTEYHGLRTSFKYCKKCDHKEGSNG